MTQQFASQYQADILGTAYEQTTLQRPNDYEGKVTATLSPQKTPQQIAKAVLYIHGFIDYFFQKEMTEQFNQHDSDFYALGLRKYGRSILPHQKYYNVRNITEYEAEINQTLEIIRAE